MINALITWSLHNRLLLACGTLLLMALGIKALHDTPVDAIPDLSENQVIVFADWTGRSPREVEDQITYPLSLNLHGLRGVKSVRASSMFGFSLITVVFEDSVNKSLARQRILERLNLLGDTLPAGVSARLGPDATGLGWVYEYYLKADSSKAPGGHGYDLGELRALQDWFIRPQLNSEPGVAEVASVGGFERQYQIEVDSMKMRASGVSLNMVLMAVSQSSLYAGGKTIEENGMEFVVRGIGLIRNQEDIEKIVLMEKNGVPVYLRDIARLEIGGDFRRGSLDAGGGEVVGGIVVMSTGENALAVIQKIRQRMEQIAPSLPPGVTIQPFYDRGELIERTVHTLKHALVWEMILVTLAHILFLFHFRSVLIVTLPLPVSILVSFILMNWFGITSNIMSLSGIAIAIGVLVDAAIVITENAIRHCEQESKRRGRELLPAETTATVLEASRQMGRPIFFAMAIIILAFVPVFALSGQEGKLFHPLAFAKTFAMIGSTLLAVTIVPVLCTWLVRGPYHPEDKNWLMNFLMKLYEPVLDLALKHRTAVMTGALMILLGALALVPRLGTEFMPPLNEGSLLFMPSFVPATSLTEVKRAMALQDQIIQSFPEVASAVGKLGRSDTATDPAPTEMIETTILLKPESKWRAGMTREKLIDEMTSRLRQVPGSIPGFLQPIESRVLMISTGIRSQLGVKILGANAELLQAAALDVQKIVQTIPGATAVTPSRIQGKPYMEVTLNRDAMGACGMRAQDVMDVIETGLGGKNISTVIEGRNRYPIHLRLQHSERDDLTRLKDLLVTGSNGKVIPLGQLATLTRTEGPNEIGSENGRLRAFVQANVEGRDLGGFVEEVKARLAKEMAPQLASKGMTLEYSGEYENQLHAAATLKFIIPGALLIIFMLLHLLYGNAREAAHVLLAVPFALSGGVIFQYLAGWHFSVAVWVGYIALFGTAIQTGVVMVVYLEEAVRRKQELLGANFSNRDLVDAVKEGARLRLRPKVMTVCTVVASLLPMLWSHGAGSEVMKPLVTPIIGGMLSSLVHILIVTPVIFAWLRSGDIKNLGSRAYSAS